MSSKKRSPKTVPTPTVDRFLNRNSALFFSAFSLFVLWAFWPTYFARLGQAETRQHLHGIAMTLWCGMLITQAFLIRSGDKQSHRLLGKLSYVLVPLIVLATTNFVHLRMRASGLQSSVNLFFLTLMLNAVVAFVVIYGLAIYYRRKPALHARYMLCTVFPLFTPVTDRLIFRNFQFVEKWVPVLDGVPLIQVAGFLLADAILVALALWDWQSRKRLDAFAVSLSVIAIYQLSVLTLYRFELWKTFGEWFLSLPLS